MLENNKNKEKKKKKKNNKKPKTCRGIDRSVLYQNILR